VGQTIAVLGLLAAVLGAALRWELPLQPSPPTAPPVVSARVDRAIQSGITALKTKPRVPNRIQVKKISAVQDNSNTSYAALGVRATPLPEWAPDWSRKAVGTVERVNRSLTSSLKELARKSILGRVT